MPKKRIEIPAGVDQCTDFVPEEPRDVIRACHWLLNWHRECFVDEHGQTIDNVGLGDLLCVSAQDPHGLKFPCYLYNEDRPKNWANGKNRIVH